MQNLRQDFLACHTSQGFINCQQNKNKNNYSNATEIKWKSLFHLLITFIHNKKSLRKNAGLWHDHAVCAWVSSFSTSEPGDRFPQNFVCMLCKLAAAHTSYLLTSTICNSNTASTVTYEVGEIIPPLYLGSSFCISRITIWQPKKKFSSAFGLMAASSELTDTVMKW